MVVSVQSPNHWTTREFPFTVMLKQMQMVKLEEAEARRRLLQWSKRKTMEAVIVAKKKKWNELIQEMFEMVGDIRTTEIYSLKVFFSIA